MISFEKLSNDLLAKTVHPKDAYDLLREKDMMRRINYYAHLSNISSSPLKDGQLQELRAIVEVLQILYDSDAGSPISDSQYDSLQELLIDMGIPRITKSIELSAKEKLQHTYRNLRGTLDKVYYLDSSEPRKNKHRKYLDEWIKASEAAYEKATGEKIDLDQEKVLLQCKFDGTSVILESGEKPVWITRGDTDNNLASDVSHIMNIFNDVYCHGEYGIKFECMMTEENMRKINELYREHPYHNSRQIVTSILNSNEADFKVDYLYPVPLRIQYPGDRREQIHPMLIEKFPTKICTLGDRDIIRQFANQHRYAVVNGMRFRTDGVVITILNPKVQEVLGRENNINKFEIAYKFTEESCISKAKDVEFYVSDFGFITPVLVVNDVIMKGNTINHISLSNKDRFDELDLHYGDEVKVSYDIIPYASIDQDCRKVQNGRKIQFIQECPMCHEELDLSATQVQCKNDRCPSRIIGRVLNYCQCLRIQNIGYQTLETMYHVGLLKHGIRSLYKLRKKTIDVEDLDGFGKLKTRKIVSEIESKRKLKDYEFFGSIGIPGVSMKTCRLIFSDIKLSDFVEMIRLKNYSLMKEKLVHISGIGDKKAEILVAYFKIPENKKEVEKLIGEEVTLIETYGNRETNGRIVFTGCRPTDQIVSLLTEYGYEPSDSWTNSAKYLVIPYDGFSSSKTKKAMEQNVPIVTISDLPMKLS